MAIGILIFLLWDVLAGAIEPVEAAVTDAADHGGSWLRVIGLGAVDDGGRSRSASSRSCTTSGSSIGKSHAAVGARCRGCEPGPVVDVGPVDRAAAARVLYRAGNRLHNFSEGLAIGQAAASDEISLALLLIIGFGLHNATEGFGIVAPMTAEGERPSWAFLGLMGLIGGGPTFVGTADRPVVGQRMALHRVPRASRPARSSTS